MSKRVLDVGNCVPDHAALCRLIGDNFSAEVNQTHSLEDTVTALRAEDYDLVLINRKLDRDYSDGLDIIKRLKADEELATTPVMLITNYADHQQLAVAAGAELGFGKLELEHPDCSNFQRVVLERFLEWRLDPKSIKNRFRYEA